MGMLAGSGKCLGGLQAVQREGEVFGSADGGGHVVMLYNCRGKVVWWHASVGQQGMGTVALCKQVWMEEGVTREHGWVGWHMPQSSGLCVFMCVCIH